MLLPVFEAFEVEVDVCLLPLVHHERFYHPVESLRATNYEEES